MFIRIWGSLALSTGSGEELFTDHVSEGGDETIVLFDIYPAENLDVHAERKYIGARGLT